MIPSGVSRMLASVRLTLFSSALFVVVACGEAPTDANPADTSQPQTAAPVPTTPTATPAAPPADAGASGEPVATEETVPEEVSEAEDAPVTSASTTANAPPLRLAAVEQRPAPRSAFKEGVHYRRLTPTQPTQVGVGQIEILEIFWYGCPHCFALDPKLEMWRKNAKAPYVEFRRVPATWNDISLFHARVFYAADLLDKLEELHTPIFREIHVNGNALNTMEKVKTFFTSQGVAAADFDRKLAALELERKIQNASLLARRYRVPGVPFFIVNGKYTADVQSAGGEDQLLLLIAELAAREHSGL
jgi:thiol:disulfide interchange protein DsbA